MGDKERDVPKELDAVGFGRVPHPHPIAVELRLFTHHVMDGGRMIRVEVRHGFGFTIAKRGRPRRPGRASMLMLQHGEAGHVEGPVALGCKVGIHLVIRDRLARRVDQSRPSGEGRRCSVRAAVRVRWMDRKHLPHADIHAVQGIEEAMCAVLAEMGCG